MKVRVLVLAGLALVSSSAFGQVLNTNATANNGGSSGWAMFFNLSAVGASPISVTHLTTASTAAVGGAFSVEVFTRTGTALGGPVGSGPGSSSAGWTSIGSAAATQGGVASGISQLIDIPDIFVGTGGVTGVALRFTGAGPRYFGTGAAPLQTFADANLSITTGDVRSVPFTTGGSFFSSRGHVGQLNYAVVPEPGTMAALGLGAVALLRRRKKA